MTTIIRAIRTELTITIILLSEVLGLSGVSTISPVEFGITEEPPMEDKSAPL